MKNTCKSIGEQTINVMLRGEITPIVLPCYTVTSGCDKCKWEDTYAVMYIKNRGAYKILTVTKIIDGDVIFDLALSIPIELMSLLIR